jgi:hypothetical protein
MSKTIAVIQDKSYPLKVWLTTILAGSTIFTIYDLLLSTSSDFGDFFGAISILLLFNIILSLPALLFFYIGFGRLNSFQLSVKRKRSLLILLAFSLFLFTWCTVNSIFGRDAFFSTKSIFIYADFFVCITISSLVFGRSTTPNTN